MRYARRSHCWWMPRSRAQNGRHCLSSIFQKLRRRRDDRGSGRRATTAQRLREIRLRFTRRRVSFTAPMSLKRDRVIIPDERAVYEAAKGDGTAGHRHTAMSPAEKAVRETMPARIRSRSSRRRRPWLHADEAVSRGYLDDACDGVVYLGLTISGTALTASARISSGPPDFAPELDHRPQPRRRPRADRRRSARSAPRIAPRSGPAPATSSAAPSRRCGF